MSFDVAIFGALAVSPGDMKSWKRVIVDPSQYRVIARVFPESPNLEPTAVGVLLKELPAAGGYDLFQIEPDDGMYSVRGQFAERAFRKHARRLAALFMSASQVDIRGDVYFLGKGVREGYAVQPREVARRWRRSGPKRSIGVRATRCSTPSATTFASPPSPSRRVRGCRRFLPRRHVRSFAFPGLPVRSSIPTTPASSQAR